MIVGYESALDFWRATRAAYGGRDVLDPEGRVFGARQLSSAEQASLAINLCASEDPLDVVLKSREGRHGLPSVRDHVWRAPLTDEHLQGLGNGIFVCKMPVVLCQLASSWDVLEVAEVACEMAGTYGVTPWSDRGFEGNMEPLVDLAEFRGYASAAKALRVRGASRAVSALDLSAACSNSPRESDVAIFFLQSRALGGVGLAGFTMNRRLDLPESLVELTGRKYLVPDFMWDNGTIVEYDSEQEHLSPEARARDEAKRRAFQAEGLDWLTLTNGILRSNSLLNLFVRDLEESLGLTRRPLSAAMEARRTTLRERLFGPESVEASLKALSGTSESL